MKNLYLILRMKINIFEINSNNLIIKEKSLYLLFADQNYNITILKIFEIEITTLKNNHIKEIDYKSNHAINIDKNEYYLFFFKQST